MPEEENPEESTGPDPESIGPEESSPDDPEGSGEAGQPQESGASGAEVPEAEEESVTDQPAEDPPEQEETSEADAPTPEDPPGEEEEIGSESPDDQPIDEPTEEEPPESDDPEPEDPSAEGEEPGAEPPGEESAEESDPSGEEELSPEELMEMTMEEEDPPEEAEGEEELEGGPKEAEEEPDVVEGGKEDRPQESEEEEERPEAGDPPEEEPPEIPEEPDAPGEEETEEADTGGEETGPPETEEGEETEESTVPDETEQEEPDEAADESTPEESKEFEEVTEPAGAEQPEEEEGGSIQDMLQEESRRTQEEGSSPPEIEEDDEEEEEELPGGYLTVDQLPEEEEFKIPSWLKYGGYILVSALFVYLTTSFLMLPLWENYHVMQVQTEVDNGNFQKAESLARRGMILGGLFIHYPDEYIADFLKSLLEARRYDQFTRVHEEYTNAGLSGPRIDQMYTQYLLNRGRWDSALPRAEQLQTQTDIDVRGFGYLFRARALLENDRLAEARENLDQARIWLSDHPEVERMERDMYIAEKNFEQAQTIATRLRSRISRDDELNHRVRDYVQLARIYANLDRHQVTEDMLSQALSLDPDNRVALRELTFRYLLQDRWDRVEPYILGRGRGEGYREIHPYESFGWWAEAEYRLSTDRYGEAVPLLERARALDPRDAEIYRVYGRLHLDRLDDPFQATRYFERARRYGLDRLTFVEMMARSYYESGQYSQAVKEYQSLTKHLEGNSLELTYNLGSSFLGAGEYARAEALLDQAFDSGYRNTNIYNQRGLLEELRGEPVDAQAVYLEGIQWGTLNNRPVQILRDNLDRSLADQSAEPLTEWLAPVDKDIEIPYWLRLDPEGDIGGL